MQQRALQQKKTYTSTLYKVVFESVYVKFAVAGLFILLLVQPVAPVFAQGEDVALPENGSSVTEFVEPTVVDTGFDSVLVEDEDIEPPLQEEVEVVSDVSASSSLEFLSESPVTSSSSDGAVGGEEDAIGSVAEGDDGNGDNQEEVHEVATSSDETRAHFQDSEPPIASSTPPSTSTELLATSTPQDDEVPIATEIVEEVIIATTTTPVLENATTTDEVLLSTEEVTPQIQTSPAFEFSTKECASVGDGAYYCSTVEHITDPLKDDIFAAPDAGGDMEIYVRLNGEERVITTNTTDDLSPYYDMHSERIVWHRLVNDRYQVVSYDLKTNEETVLTNTSYNNMEPVAYENITLWQAWILNNWEILMFDGVQVVQITNNTLQDVSPHMREGYIVWQTQFSDGWQVAVYDQKTKTVEYIPSESGLKVENPRFVLVYDSTDDNGDVQTLGYDFNNKKSFTLGSLPAQLPEELPEPDQTGETRALIQSKQSSKEGETEVQDTPIPASNNSASSSSSFGTLDLSQGTSTISATTSTSDAVTDLIIPHHTATTTESQIVPNSNDIVIPPFSATSTEEVS